MTRRRAPGGGRKPLPASIKVLRGNPGGRDISAAVALEARLERGVPRAPSDWRGDRYASHRRAWREMGHELAAMGVLSKCDRRALELLVEPYVRWKRCSAKVVELGDVISEGDPPRSVRSPWAIAAEKAWQQFRTMCTEFGTTPSSRSKVAGVASSAATVSQQEGQQAPHDATARYFK